MRVKEIGLFSSIISILVCSSMLYAADVGTNKNTNNEDVFTLGEIVVTADRETITKVSTVETIDASQINLTNVNNVSDALDTLPGVVISVGSRNEKYFTIRGFNQRYVPVLYDGIPIYVPYDGYLDSGELPTGNISKITLTKGVSSVLYGPNTMGGVINIITKKPTKLFEADYKLGVDDNHGKSFNVNLGSMLTKFYFTANISGLKTDGFNLSHKFQATVNENGDERNNSDNKQVSGSFKVGFLPSEGHEYAIGINKIKSEKGLPPTAASDVTARYWRVPHWDKLTYYLIGDSLITEKLMTKIRLFHDTYYNIFDSYDDATYTTQKKKYAFHSTYDDYSNGGSFVLRSEYIDNNIMSFGFNYKDDVHRSQGNYGGVWDRYEAKILSYGLEDDIKFNDRLSAVLGINDDVQKETYANGNALRGNIDTFNPQFGLDYLADDNTDIHFSVGKKTRFPNLKELYSEYLGSNIANPNLKPENAVNYEVGFKKLLGGNSNMEVNLFYSDIKNLIVSKSVGGGMSQNQNIGKAFYRGIELIGKTVYFTNNEIEMNYTYLDAQDRSPDRTSDLLPETSKHKLYLSDKYNINEMFSFFGKFEYDSKRYEYVSPVWKTLDGFCTVDAKVMANITKKMSLEFGSKNIFDKNYETKYGYPREGRSFFLTLTGNI